MSTNESVFTESLLTQAHIASANADTVRRVLDDLIAGKYGQKAGRDDAIAAYKILATLTKKIDDMQAQLKSWLRRSMEADGISEYHGDLGSARIVPGATRVTWDGKALDALMRSDRDLQRVLEPHRAIKIGEPILRIE